jgi:hypothetical protein
MCFGVYLCSMKKSKLSKKNAKKKTKAWATKVLKSAMKYHLNKNQQP